MGSSGPIGMAIVEHLAGRHYEVAGLDRKEGFYDRQYVVDLATPEALDALDNFAASTEGMLHLVHAAGGANQESLQNPSAFPSDISIHQDVNDNFISAVRLCSWAQGKPRVRSITLLSSINGRRPFGIPVYSATKAAISGLVASSSRMFAHQGTRLNVLTLGTVDHVGVRARYEDDAHFDDLLAEAPLGRFLTLNDLCNAVTFCIENESLAGSEIVLDAGQQWSL